MKAADLKAAAELLRDGAKPEDVAELLEKCAAAELPAGGPPPALLKLVIVCQWIAIAWAHVLPLRLARPLVAALRELQQQAPGLVSDVGPPVDLVELPADAAAPTARELARELREVLAAAEKAIATGRRELGDSVSDTEWDLTALGRVVERARKTVAGAP